MDETKKQFNDVNISSVIPRFALTSETRNQGSQDLYPFCIVISVVHGVISKFDGDVQFQVRATLFDYKSLRFIGRTWIGSPIMVHLSSLHPTSVTYQQNIYFLTTEQDSKMSVVFEITASTNERSNHYSLGWGRVSLPFYQFQTRDEIRQLQNEEKRTPLYYGSPRVLLMFEGSNESLPPILGCEIQYKIFPHPRLLKVAYLLPKNCIIGASDDVPGLTKSSKSRYQNDILWKPSLEITRSFFLNTVVVHLPSIKEFEKEILLVLKKENDSNLKATERASSKRITERRLKTFVYNGWKTIQEQLHHLIMDEIPQIGQKSSKSKIVSEDYRESKMTVQHQLNFRDIPNDSRIAIIFVLEYLVSWNISSKQSSVPSILKTCTTPIALLSGVWFPFKMEKKKSEEIRIDLKGGPGCTPDGELLFALEKEKKNAGSYCLSFYYSSERQSNETSFKTQLTLQEVSPTNDVTIRKEIIADIVENETLPIQEEHFDSPTDNIPHNVENAVPQPPPETFVKVVSNLTPTVTDQDNDDDAPVTYGPYVPVTPVMPQYPFSGQMATRGALTTLHSVGFSTIKDRHGHPATVLDPLLPSAIDKTVELQDVLQCNCIILQFLAFSSYMPFSWDSVPKVIFLTFQFYRFSPTKTERLILKQLSPGLLPEPDFMSYILYPLQDLARLTTQSPGFIQKYTVDPAHLSKDENEAFLDYLYHHNLFLDLWDGDSLLYLGSASFPLKYFFRQGRDAIQMTLELDVLYNEYTDEPQPSSNTSIRGKLHLRIGNAGFPLSLSSLKILHKTNKSPLLDNSETRKIKTEFPVVQQARPLVETDRKLLSLLGSHILKPKHVAESSTSLSDNQRRKLARMSAIRNAGTESPELEDVHQFSSKTDRWDELKVIESYREHHKHEKIISVLEQAISQDKYLYPVLGHASFFEFEFVNVMRTERRITIEIDSSEIKVVTDAREWSLLRENNELSENVEEHFLTQCNREGNPTWQVLLQPREKIRIPFKYQCIVVDDILPSRLESVTGHHFSTEMLKKMPSTPYLQAKTVTVTCKAEDRKTVCVLHVHLQPLPPPLDLMMHFLPPENDLFKKWIRVPLNVVSRIKNVQQLSVRCSDPAVICGIHRKPDSKNPVHIYLKVPCKDSGRSQSFYIFLFADSHQHKPVHVWSVVVDPQHRIDVVCIAGDKYSTSVILRGFHTSRLVQLYSSHPKELMLDPDQPFVLTSGTMQEMNVDILSLHAGKRHMHVTLVDKELHQLLRSWLIMVTCHKPPISKAFQIQTFLHNGTMKQISFTNPYKTRKAFTAHSNSPDLLHLQDSTFVLDPGRSHVLGLFIRPQIHPCSSEVLVFINNEDNKNEETFALQINSS